MKRRGVLWGVAAVIVIAILVGAVYISDRVEVSSDGTLGTEGLPSETARAIDFTLTDLDGKYVSMRELRGHTVYLNFWTTWCKYCKKEMPELQQVSEQYRDKNVIVITVNIGEDKKTAADYIQSHGYPFRVLLDTEKTLTKAYGIKSIPVSIIVDPLGNIKHKQVGAMTGDQMKEALDSVLQGKE